STGKALFALKERLHNVKCVAFSGDGSRIVTAGTGQPRVWNARTGDELLTLKSARLGRKDEIESVAFAPNGEKIVGGGADGTVKVWDARTGNELHTLEGLTGVVRCVAFSEDGSRIVTGDGTRVRVWDTGTGNELVTLEGHSRQVAQVGFS